MYVCELGWCGMGILSLTAPFKRRVLSPSYQLKYSKQTNPVSFQEVNAPTIKLKYRTHLCCLNFYVRKYSIDHSQLALIDALETWRRK